MDQTVTPSNNPLIGGLDADKFLYESLTKRGRAIPVSYTHLDVYKRQLTFPIV